MVDTPEYFLLGAYDQVSNSFAAATIQGYASSVRDGDGSGTAARLYPADFGVAFASQTFWDAQLRRRLLAVWLATANNTHGIPRELSIVPDEDDSTQHSLRFAPIRELASLRLGGRLQTLTLSANGSHHHHHHHHGGHRDDTSVVEGFEKMDILANFSAPVGGWEVLSARRTPCYFGVRLRLGGRSSGHAVWIQSHCNASMGADPGCAALDYVSTHRMDQAFRNGAGVVPDRAAHLTLDTGDTNASVPLGNLFGSTQLLGGPLVLPRGGAPLQLRVVVDHSLVEAFASGRGSVSGFAPRLAMDYEPDATGVALESSCEGVGATAELWEMRAAELTI